VAERDDVYEAIAAGEARCEVPLWKSDSNFVSEMLNALGLRLLALIPRCYRRFPDGWCFYRSGSQLGAINRLHFDGWKTATWDELFTRYRRYWRQLPVKVGEA
jgi:hypothetical protein